MLPWILAAIAALIVLFVLVVATRPADFRISRSATMSCRPEAAFAQVNDFHNWDGWSPWAKIDPNCKVTFEGPPAGVGSVMKWSGNSKVGEGISTITESRPGELVRLKLQFLRPMKCTNTAEFTFKPQGDQTIVTWSNYGQNGFVGNLFHMLLNCDKMLGGEFEKGLASMKTIVESQPARVAVASN